MVDTGEIQTTSYTSPSLSTEQTLYARIHTLTTSGWVHSDASFVAGPAYAAFLYPTDEAVDVNPAQPFRWTRVTGALAYYLYVDRKRVVKDVLDEGVSRSQSNTA